MPKRSGRGRGAARTRATASAVRARTAAVPLSTSASLAGTAARTARSGRSGPVLAGVAGSRPAYSAGLRVEDLHGAGVAAGRDPVEVTVLVRRHEREELLPTPGDGVDGGAGDLDALALAGHPPHGVHGQIGAAGQQNARHAPGP